jgi:hypothetical protein
MPSRTLLMKNHRIALDNLLLLIVGVLIVFVGLFIIAVSIRDYSPNMVLELLTGETPQAKITNYLRAVQAQDRAAALDAWYFYPSENGAYAGLGERRDALTDELLALRITSFTISELEWWATCCEPHAINSPRNAGGARVRVEIMGGSGDTWPYTFDVFTEGGAYFGDAAGNPYRHWLLRDVYPEGEPPIYWKAK